MATLLKVLNNLADIKSAGVLHFASELRAPFRWVDDNDHLGTLMPFGAVAVGTAIAGRPPHRSRRAVLPHRAPTSGD
jgi:hypothetical protein